MTAEGATGGLVVRRVVTISGLPLHADRDGGAMDAVRGLRQHGDGESDVAGFPPLLLVDA